MNNNVLHTLIPLEDFKSLLGIDDRDDRLSGHCLETATKTIEHYCNRHLLREKHFEQLEYTGELLLPMGEYPVHRVLVVYALTARGGDGEIIEPDFYSVIPECGTDYDLPFSLSLSRAIQRQSGIYSIKAVYWAGYSTGLVPADLASACLELASWNMNRYKGRRIGMTGNVRGGGRDGEHFEKSMPENVKALLEPYRRKLI
jgi:hypothetical protein